MLLHEGAPGAYVLALSEGRVIVTKASADGEEMIMAIGDPGEILGDMTILDQSPRSATVTALTKWCPFTGSHPADLMLATGVR